MKKVIYLDQLVEEIGLKILTGKEYLHKEIVFTEIHRPGIELTGYILENDNDIENRIQVFGKEEMKYLNSLPKKIREYNLVHYLAYEFPCIILTGDLAISYDLIYLASLNSKPILHTKLSLEEFMKILQNFLQKELASEIALKKFTMMEIFGMGIMITGDESAKIGATIELLEKGHIFVTDDILTLKRISDSSIIGQNSYTGTKKEHKYYLKINENEKINIVDYYGIGSTRESKGIDLIVKFEEWDKNKFYDRLGIEEETQYLLGLDIPKLTIPIRKGRNLGILIETAALNQRLKKSGMHSATYFLNETKKLIKINSKNKKGGKKMNILKTLQLKDIISKFNLKVLSGEENIENIEVIAAKVHRPSLEFTGFYDILEESGKNKLQLLGETELKYLDKMSKESRDKHLKKYMNYRFPAIILSGIVTIPDYFQTIIDEKQKVLLSSKEKTSKLMIDMNEYLNKEFAPYITLHGVLVEVFGFGVLLTGKSGIGKSETALELIHRGHRLIADDMVKFTKYFDGRIVGKAERVPYFMEIRGLGIIDIKTLYGLSAVRRSKQLDIILNLEELEKADYLTKTDYEEEEKEILGEKIPKINLQISFGRNAASMVEIATMNLRAKIGGYDSTESYIKNHENMKHLEKKADKKENIFKNIGNFILRDEKKK